uniref:Uncharacterized protein n=1 Tax=Candidatus Kentrum sp. TC TaxID=2126339 RepID=A0A450YI27_9GAMM|nr:MAG: hypothetical protein BECKTC1821E_GA0114239_10105 [Candidatus Kentron sp. TC]
MKERVLFIGDLQRGNQLGNAYKIFLLFSPVFREIGIKCETRYSHINLLRDPTDWLEIWRSSLRQRNDEYLEELELTANTAIVGFELPDEDLAYLNKKNISWVNLSIHPFRFLNDLHFEVNASFDFNREDIQASLGEIELCANMLRIKYSFPTVSKRYHTLAIFGQEPFDKSVYFDGKFMLLDEYIDKLDVLAKEHDEVIYKHHPYQTDEAIDKLIFDRYSAKPPIDNNPYRLMLSGEVSTVCAISSSIISEASAFGLRAEYLEPRAKRFSSPVNYRQLLDNQDFWVRGLLSHNEPVEWKALSGSVPEQLLRESFAYWGFRTPQIELSEHVSTTITTLLQQVEASTQRTESRLSERTTEAESRAAAAEARVTDLLNSASWRITAPLRWGKSLLVRASSLPDAAKHRAKMPIRSLALYVGGRPALRKAALAVLDRFPGLKYRLMGIVYGSLATPGVHREKVPTDLADLSPHARRIHGDLKAAVERRQKGGD